MDEITFTITYSVPLNGWAGEFDSDMCESGLTETTDFILSCQTGSAGTGAGDMNFTATGESGIGDVPPGCFFAYLGQFSHTGLVTESCDPFYLEAVCAVGYSVAEPSPDYGNCCDPQVVIDPESGLPSVPVSSHVRVIISEVPP